nr:hypothetical protein Q903MT_gene1814 [Picea sitchensis]
MCDIVIHILIPLGLVGMVPHMVGLVPLTLKPP